MQSLDHPSSLDVAARHVTSVSAHARLRRSKEEGRKRVDGWISRSVVQCRGRLVLVWRIDVGIEPGRKASRKAETQTEQRQRQTDTGNRPLPSTYAQGRRSFDLLTMVNYVAPSMCQVQIMQYE